MSFLPIIILGGALVLFSKKKKRRSSKKNEITDPLELEGDLHAEDHALIAEGGRGTVFEGSAGSAPNLIESSVGERFSVSLRSTPSREGESPQIQWSLSASPADDSIKHVRTEQDNLAPSASAETSSQDVYIFEGSKPGKGSLVFHLQAPWLKGKEPPEQIVEIITEIS